MLFTLIATICVHSTITNDIQILHVQGKNASTKDKARSALYTSQLDRELNDAALQVRVVQGHEPRHFLKIFKGKLVTYTNDDAADKVHLFRIRGTCAEDVRADERDAIASSLASDDVFVLRTPSNAFIWNGLVSATKVLFNGIDLYTQMCYLDLFCRALRNSKKKWLLLSLMLLLQITHLTHK